MKNLENIQVGDKVWWQKYDRWGVISKIDKGKCPLEVRFCKGFNPDDRCFTLDGRYYEDEAPSLFFDKFEIQYPKRAETSPAPCIAPSFDEVMYSNVDAMMAIDKAKGHYEKI